MKNLSIISSIFALFIILSGCGSDKNEDPTPDTQTAKFRVELTQSGDFTKFVKIVTIGGGDFTYTGTNNKMPAVLSGDNIDDATISVEAKDVVELNINSLTEFSAVEEGPATMTMKFAIYKNDKLIDEKTYTYNEATREKAELLNYKAK